MEESLKEQILALFNLIERPDLELKVCKYNPNYYITNYGDVVSNFRNKLVKIKPDFNNGYLRYKIQTGSKKSSFFGHRLVAVHFIPTDGDVDDLVVNHIDGSRTNNYYKNLEWCTASENSNHAYWVRRGKVDIKTYNSEYKIKSFKIKNTGLPKKTTVDTKLLDQYNIAVRKGFHLPMDAYDLEVFAIKPFPECKPGMEAFIGFKTANGNFNFIQVPFTGELTNNNQQ